MVASRLQPLSAAKVQASKVICVSSNVSISDVKQSKLTCNGRHFIHENCTEIEQDRQWTYKRSIEAPLLNHCCRAKAR